MDTRGAGLRHAPRPRGGRAVHELRRVAGRSRRDDGGGDARRLARAASLLVSDRRAACPTRASSIPRAPTRRPRACARRASTSARSPCAPTRHSAGSTIPSPGRCCAGSDGALVETLLHELVHATVFVASQADFNEGVASFVGEEGSVRFFAETRGAEAAARERDRVADARRLASAMLAFRREVEAPLRERSPARGARGAARRGRDAGARSDRRACRSRRATPRALAADAAPLGRLPRPHPHLCRGRRRLCRDARRARRLAARVRRAPARGRRDGGSARGAARPLSRRATARTRAEAAPDPRLATCLPVACRWNFRPCRASTLRTRRAARLALGAFRASCGLRKSPKKAACNPASPEQRTGATDALPRLTVSEAAAYAARLRANIERALRGKPEVVRRAVETLVAGGHLLLEDVPGRRQDHARARARALDRRELPPHPVHQRPAARRSDRRGAPGSARRHASTAASRSTRGRSSRTSCSPTRSTARARRCSRRCSRR